MAFAPSRPNVLFIMADQWRHDAMSCAGADWVDTPNIDRIADKGVRFTQCTTNSPICSPARIGLAAGVQPWRIGAVDNSSFLPASARTYYHRLRDHEYRVGCVGKLDLAKPAQYNGRDGDRPVNYTYGFTHPVEMEGKMAAGTASEPWGPYGFWLAERGLFDAFHADYSERKKDWVGSCHDSILPTEAFEDVQVAERSVLWIREIPDDYPWHLFVSFVGPHDPFDPPTAYADLYRDRAMPEPIRDEMAGKPAWVRERVWRNLSADRVAVTRRQYAAAVRVIDDGVGRILSELESRGMADNTVIVVSSDHGEMLGDHGLYQKSVMYEGSLRVPLIVAGPGVVGPGRTSDALTELIDLNPTICSMAGLSRQEGIDGIGLDAILAGETDRHRDDAISALRHVECIRTADEKLIMNHNAEPELYDLAADPDELVNLAGERADRVRELGKRFEERLVEGGWHR